MNTETQKISFDTLIAENPQIKCCRDRRKTIQNALFLLVGIAFIFVANMLGTAGNDTKLILSSIGICIVGIAAIYLVHGGRGYRYVPSQSRMKRGTKFFSRTAEGFFRNIERLDKEDEWTLPIEDSNGGVRVEYIFDESNSFLMLLPSIYEELFYRPLHKEILFSGSRAKEMIRSLNLDKE